MANRSSHKQMAINMASSFVVFGLNLCVTFFLTPFIVKKLGTASYGFIGLSNNIINYMSILTIAINSMAGRFIAIKFHKQEYDSANCYLSSIFFANLFFSIVILLLVCVITAFLPNLVRIPNGLTSDVRLLFMLLGLSSCLGLMTGVIGVSAFIKNRLDLSNARNMVGTLIRVGLLLLLFCLLPAKLWYFGISSLCMCIYVMLTNYILFKKLTPELVIGKASYSFKHIKEVAIAGAWNIISKMSDILQRGFDLLLANLFISAKSMGVLAICQTIPFLVLSLVVTISGNFSPELTRLYAQGNLVSLRDELQRAVRLCGFLSCMPLGILFVYGELFYSLWLPAENAHLLYILTIMGSIGLVFSMPLEPLWNIFTITNKVKRSSLNLFFNSLCMFITVLLLIFIIKSSEIRLFVLASTRALFGCFRTLTFLPFYGAKCLGYPRWTFYPNILKNALNFGCVCSVSWIVKCFCGLEHCGWGGLIIGAVITCLLTVLISSLTVLNKEDRAFLMAKIKCKICSRSI